MIRAALSAQAGAPGAETTWEGAKAMLAGAEFEGVLWVDVADATEALLEELTSAFSLHPLTVEDLAHKNQRAKVEEFPAYLFVVMHWFAQAPDKNPCELHCVLGPNYLLTVTDTSEATMDGRQPIDAAWARFKGGSMRGPNGADGALYRVLDELVDSHMPRVDEIEEAIEQVNERVVDGSEGAQIVQELVTLRRRLTQMRRILAPERDVLSALARRDYSHIDARTALFFRDVQDHLGRTYESIESLRELDEMVMEVQLAMAESRRSIVIKRLTVVSTVFLPMSFLASFFGMNFAAIPFGSLGLLYTGLAAMVVLPVLLMTWFSVKRWV